MGLGPFAPGLRPREIPPFLLFEPPVVLNLVLNGPSQISSNSQREFIKRVG
jgi:hypothetical protein